MFARHEVELPDDRRLLVELSTLERRTARSGRDSVDHARGGHDDRSNVCCGVLVELATRRAFEGNISELAVLGRPLVGASAPWQDAPHRDLRDYDLI
jgi:hypothetical protein